MRVRLGLVMATFGAMLTVTGCGGDNLALCDGCGTPTPTVTITPTPGTPTATPATSVPSITPTRTPAL